LAEYYDDISNDVPAWLEATDDLVQILQGARDPRWRSDVAGHAAWARGSCSRDPSRPCSELSCSTAGCAWRLSWARCSFTLWACGGAAAVLTGVDVASGPL